MSNEIYLRAFKGPVYRISLAARMSIILSHSEVLLILAAREILYTGPLNICIIP